MGYIAEDIVCGRCCSHCGKYFEEGHGFPVLCLACFWSETKAQRAGLKQTQSQVIRESEKKA